MLQPITISRVFDAPREKVWKAWTDPELIKKWWGPKDFTAPRIEIDFRVGGKYLFVMRGPAGSEFDVDIYSGGEFKEIVPMEKIVVTDYFSNEKGEKLPAPAGMDPNFPSESTVTELFEEVEGGKTKLTIVYPTPETEAQMEAMLKSGMEAGWNESLDKLAESLK